MDKPMSEKKQARGRKKKEAVPDDVVLGILQEMGDLWARFFQEQMTSFGKAASTDTANLFFAEASKSDLQQQWQHFIREEINRCFQVTPIGPLRQYQEKASRFIQTFAEWENACGEFSTLLNKPLAQSLEDMEEKIQAEKQEIPVENRFPLWIELLENRYLALYRSEEFMPALHKTLQAVTSVTKAREGLMDDLLKSSHLPTTRDMDELYREIYLLKKRVELLEKELKAQHGRT
jgi:hypothetical protein